MCVCGTHRDNFTFTCIDKIQQDVTVCRYLFTANIHVILRSSATTFLQRGLIRPRWRKVVALLRNEPVPEAAVTVLCTPDDGCDGHLKHVEYICSK